VEKLNKLKMEREIQKVLALEALREYCDENKLSIEKLKEERFELSYNECSFFHPSDIKPEGLLNDKETMPKVTLMLKLEDGQLKIEETEYTKKYLSAE